MDTTLILLCILAAAFAVTRLESNLLGERVSFFTDAEYLVVGVLCGPLVSGLLGPVRMASLDPLLAAITGFVGFVVGLSLRFGRHGTRSTTWADRGFALMTCLLTGGVLATAGWAAISHLTGVAPSDPLLLIASATLGFGGVAISRQAVHVAATRSRADGPITRLLHSTAVSGQVLAIIGFGVTIATKRALVDGEQFLHGALDEVWLRVIVWNAVSLVAGVGSGFIFHLFVGSRGGSERLFLGTVGLVAFTSGIAQALDFSTLFLGLTAGVTIAAFSPVAGQVAASVTRLRRPTAVILLILAGAMWTPIEGLLWLIPVAWIGLRIVALRGTARMAAALHPQLDSEHRGIGSGLLAQGSLAAAIAVHLAAEPQAGSSTLVDVVVTTLLLSAVANELWGTSAVRRLLENSGETGRLAPAADDASADGGRDRLAPLSPSDAADAAHGAS